MNSLTKANEVKILSETESLLMLTQHWYQDDAETFRAHGEDDEPDTIVPISVLEQCHPLFPAALSASIACTNKHRADGRLVLDTLELLRNGGITIKDYAGWPQTFTEVDTVETCDETSELLSIGGIRVQLKSVEASNELVPFVVNSRWELIRFAIVDLEAAYPGLEERFKIGSALGLEDKALAQHMFSNERRPIHAPLLPDVTFE